jgi:steroid 5-alpha reductase family enzyme
MGLIMLFTLPIVKSMDGSPLSLVDYLLAGIFILFVVLETIADQQQWTFQNEKYRQLNNGEKLSGMYEKGFLQNGLWGLVRHPNYSAELAIWIVFYLFSVAATGNWINWSIAGSLLLILLFFGSSNLSESISSGKYPDYKNYQKRVPRFVPSIFKSRK